MSYDGYGWKPYVSVAERRRKAQRELDRQRKGGATISPVVIEGRQIARTFWGRSWCENLERYSDYENRLPRGRTYVRNGSVVDLQVAPGVVTARVAGSSLYRVEVRIAPVAAGPWKALCRDCAGGIDSLLELLQGRLSDAVMERLCRPEKGLFPAPRDIELDCSCPDWASMCKHVAAVLYGIGARLDECPELLFRLRGVDASELLASAGQAAPLSGSGPASEKLLGTEDLAGLFGIELEGTAASGPAAAPPKAPRARAPAARRPKARKPAPRKAASKRPKAKALPTARRRARGPARCSRPKR